MVRFSTHKYRRTPGKYSIVFQSSTVLLMFEVPWPQGCTLPEKCPTDWDLKTESKTVKMAGMCSKGHESVNPVVMEQSLVEYSV